MHSSNGNVDRNGNDSGYFKDPKIATTPGFGSYFYQRYTNQAAFNEKISHVVDRFNIEQPHNGLYLNNCSVGPTDHYLLTLSKSQKSAVQFSYQKSGNL